MAKSIFSFSNGRRKKSPAQRAAQIEKKVARLNKKAADKARLERAKTALAKARARG